MTQPHPGFLRRIALSCGSFFAILFNAELAGQVLRLRKGQVAPADDAPVMREVSDSGAQLLLGLMQREARFIDFIEEDVAAYSDADIGAAARVVHEGCRKVLREHFTIEPVRGEAEGSRITLDQDFDAAAIRVVGKVVGEPPFTGTLTHRGWRIAGSRLPKLSEGHDASLVAQAEVEL